MSLSISDFRAAIDKLGGQDGANELFRDAVCPIPDAPEMRPIGPADGDPNSVGLPLGWSLLERAENASGVAIWANYGAGALVLVADLCGPMSIWVPVKR